MTKEEFREMILEAATNEADKQAAEDWLIKSEMDFERTAKAVKWPVEKVRGAYSLFCLGMGLGQGFNESEDINND